MKDGYPEKSELKAIKNWHYNDVFALLDYIKERWWMPEWGFEEQWKDGTLILKLHTGGWSGNEGIVDALLENRMVRCLFYTAWTTGGHFTFEIKAAQISYKTLKEIMKQTGFSRQYILQTPHKFDRIKRGKRNNLYRIKEVTS